jgi:carboxyl-terminal processing protease
MPTLRPALLTVTLLTLSGVALASPASTLFDASAQLLLTNYYGWSQADRPALVDAYRAQLETACQSSTAQSGPESCSYDTARTVIKAMLAELQDAHSNIRDPEGAERLREVQQDLSVQRTGVRVIKTPAGLLVVGVQPDSPAQAAGLARFDLITRVNGQVAGTDQAIDSLVFVRLERAGGVLSLEVTRAGQPGRSLGVPTALLKARDVPTLSWNEAGGVRTAVINYPTFLSGDSAESFLKVFRAAQQGGMQRLIVDLRYNGGGRLDQCVAAASIFGPVLYQSRWNGGGWSYGGLDGQEATALSAQFAPAAQALWRGPTTLLVGENTASCAEVFSFYARQHGAQLVGERTKGVMNSGVNFYGLPDKGVLSVTVLRAYDAAGTALPDHLEPDVVVASDLNALTLTGRDEVMERALSLGLAARP